MRRRHALAALAVMLGAPRPGVAQRPPARIGYLTADTPTANPQRLQALREGLRELGRFEGRSVVIEPRWAEGRFERLPDLAAELVRLPVQVIVAVGDPVVTAARQVTASIPIVMASVGDPLGRGFIQSFARPGGNITGVSNFSISLVGKWLESLKEAVPALARVAVLRNAVNATHILFWHEAQAVALRLGLQVQAVDVARADDIDGALAAIRNAGAGALVVLPDALLSGILTRRIADLALEQRLATMCTFSEQAVLGCLMSFGPDLTRNHHRAAFYVDRILKGANPAELPVEQPSRFVSVVNLRSAKALGIAIPQTLLLRADDVIS
jgi:putative tryptophan/tyrosine transport system substrate-binding protein